MKMDVYALLDFSKPPQRLSWSEGSQSYYHYFSPPLPSNVVLFTATKDETKDKFKVKISIDSSLEDKVLGELNKDNTCINWSGEWSSEEIEGAGDVLKLDRVLKLIVSKPDHDEGIGSQDLSKDDIVFSDDEVDEFEKSVEKFEKEFKENQKTIKSFYKKVNTRSGTKKTKVSDFFKPKEEKKDILTDSSNKDSPKTSSKIESENTSAKRPNPFKSDDIKSKKAFTTPKTPESSAKKKAKKPTTPKFSDLIANERPSERWGHKLCRICNNKALLIGGQGVRHQMNADSLWLLDLKKKTWKSDQSDNPAVDRRVGHSVAYDDKKNVVYIYGGSKHKKWYNDVYALDVDSLKWEKMETIGKAPTRSYHSCNKFYDELLIFGGVYPNPDPTPDGCSNELVIYDIEGKSWYTPIVDGDIPTPRSGHSAVVMNSKLYFFGGWDAPKCHQDLYSLDIVIMKFKKLEPTGEPPSSRTWHSTTILKDKSKFCIYGGYDGNKSLNDIFIFDSVKISWTAVSQKDVISRVGHMALLDTDDDDVTEDENKLIVFGGGDNEGSYFNDLVEIII